MIDRLISTLKALMNGAVEQAGVRNDLALLSAQIRDAGAAVRAARKAVALAKAQNEQDRRRIGTVADAIADLELRAKAALAKGADPLARDAAEAIAVLEDEHAALSAAVSAFEEDIAVLTDNLRRAEARLRELERGQRVANVREHVRTASTLGAAVRQSSLTEAEDTLTRIRDRQERGMLADEALASLSALDRPKELVSRLAEAGCGAPERSSADAVLDRLQAANPILIAKS